jgi:hypothetical protein
MTSGVAISPRPRPENPQQAQQPQHRNHFKGIMLRLKSPKAQQTNPSRNMAILVLRLLHLLLRRVAPRMMQEMPMKWALLRPLRLLRLSRVKGASPAPGPATTRST